VKNLTLRVDAAKNLRQVRISRAKSLTQFRPDFTEEFSIRLRTGCARSLVELRAGLAKGLFPGPNALSGQGAL